MGGSRQAAQSSAVNVVTILSGDDGWTAVYVNGTLELQDRHSTVNEELHELLEGLAPFTIDRGDREVDADWLDEQQEFPDELSDVVFADD